MGKYDVIVIGGIGIDTNIYLFGNEIDFNIEVNFSENIDYIGQAGGYCSRLFSNLGKKTALIDFIGNDYHGKYIIDTLKKQKIDFFYFIDKKGTKRSINFMYPDGRRKNFYDAKDSIDVFPDLEICTNLMHEAKFTHFSIINWCRYLLPIAKKLKKIISVDLQDLVDINDEYRKDFIKYADFIFYSSVNSKNIEYNLSKILEYDSEKKVIVGMGRDGCAFGDKNGLKFFPALEFGEKVIDTNGAGDSLAVGFLTSFILDNYSLEDSILRGQIAARYTCTLKADSENLISIEELNNIFMKFKNK